ncbi:MAG: hypothetical protein DI556_14570 [Rhodovulum sulfidophilum]|uniref:Uncharacterized protein n=1 Tax=Rhodovulum sulfidophilum TaxID=35806 RepID=A0A2W5PUC9_RHOSU|nr:MAG: hypothetical protein DI556_14570 [Rhodovulum sulfidophilum]
MPPMVKIGLSVMVALAALAGWIFMRHLGQTGPQWALAFLGPFSVVSLWIFPEVMRTKGDGRKKA